MFTFPVGFFGGGTPGGGDPYWNNVVLYLPLTGTNGQTTFTDVSQYGHAVTRNGNAQISTAQYPSLTGVGSSLYLDGSGDSLTSAFGDGSSFGTGDYTVRNFVRFLNTSLTQIIFDFRGTSYTNSAPVLYTLSGNILLQYGTSSPIISTPVPAANIWHYIGVSRQSGMTKLFINGSQVASTSDTRLFYYYRVDIGATYTGASPFFGNISHFQIYKSVAIDLTTVPAAPYPTS